MAGATSTSLATVTLLLLPFDIVTTILRFRVRLARRVWGSDDWAMLISIVRSGDANIHTAGGLILD